MKKFFIAILAAIVLFITPVAFTGCSEFEAALDMAFENECLREENDELKSQIEDLQTEVATLKFEAAFPNGLVTENCILNTVDINRTEVNIEGSVYAVRVEGEGVEVTINGGSYNAGEGSLYNITIWAHNKSTIIINDGYFTSGNDVNGEANHVVYAAGGSTITINGGYFESKGDASWLLNCQDNNGTIIVKGGTFVNFDPSNCISEGEGTNFVPEGYMVVSEVFNKDTEDQYILYTVIEAPVENEEVESEEEISPEEF